MEKSENEQSEQQQDAEVSVKAMRPPRSGITERLVAQELFQGTFTDIPCKKINHFCSAGMGCAELMKDELEEGEPLPYDLDEINRIYAVNLSFMNVVPETVNENEQLVYIPWGFDDSEENYNLYVLPWRKEIYLSFWTARVKGFSKPGYAIRHTNQSYRNSAYSTDPPFCNYEFATCDIEDGEETLRFFKQQYVKCPVCGRWLGDKQEDHLELWHTNVFKNQLGWDFFFAATRALTENGAKNLRNAFQQWAIPILEKAKMEMARFISPQTYEDIARLFIEGGKEEHDNGNGNRKPELPG